MTTHAPITVFSCGRRKDEEDHRDDDLRALRALLEDVSALNEREREAFAGMLETLEEGKYRDLTPKQRKWVTEKCDELGIAFTAPAERNRDIPRGKEVPVPEVLRNLPKRPPRKVGYGR